MALSSGVLQTSLPQSSAVEAILARPLPEALVPSPSHGQVSDQGHQHVVLSDTTPWSMVCQIQTNSAQSDSSGSPVVHKI